MRSLRIFFLNSVIKCEGRRTSEVGKQLNISGIINRFMLNGSDNKISFLSKYLLSIVINSCSSYEAQPREVKLREKWWQLTTPWAKNRTLRPHWGKSDETVERDQPIFQRHYSALCQNLENTTVKPRRHHLGRLAGQIPKSNRKRQETSALITDERQVKRGKKGRKITEAFSMSRDALQPVGQ